MEIKLYIGKKVVMDIRVINTIQIQVFTLVMLMVKSLNSSHRKEKSLFLLLMEMTFTSLLADFYSVPSPKHSKSTILNPKKTEVVFNTNYTTNFVPSPDNKWVAFTELYKVYISPMPKTGQPIGLSAKTKMSTSGTGCPRCRYQPALVS
jgi:hypothetical protein